MSEFSSVRANIRTQESECDSLLTQLSDMIADPSDTTQLETEIDSNLAARTNQVRELYNLAYEPGASQTMLLQAQRHSEVLDDHKKTCKRLKSVLSQERSRRTLLSSVRQDIQSHRSGMGSGSGSGRNTPIEQTAEAERYYGDEMSRVNHSHSVVDTLLNNAYEARAEMVRQQQTLKDVQKRMLHVMGRIPGVNTLISKINTRQKRNSLVLATVIVLCVLFIYFVR